MKCNILGIIIAVSIQSVAPYPIAPHPAVLAVGHEEMLLPPHLRKPANFNHRLREILPLTSLLHHGENLVYDREADKVSRHEIYKILTHAGFLGRHSQIHGLHLNHLSPLSHAPNFDSNLLNNPELLQYL